MEIQQEFRVFFRRYKLAIYIIIALIGIILLGIVISSRRDQATDEFVTILSNLGVTLVGSAFIFFVLDFFLLDERVNKQSGIILRNRIQISESVNERLSHVKNLYLHDHTLQALAGGNDGVFKEKVKAGCRIRFLLLDPTSATTRTVKPLVNPTAKDTIRGDIRASVRWLEPLLKLGNVEIRYTSVATPFGFWMATLDDSTAYIQIEIYGYGLETEQDRAHFFVEKNAQPDWYDFFKKQCEALWEDAKPYQDAQ